MSSLLSKGLVLIAILLGHGLGQPISALASNELATIMARSYGDRTAAKIIGRSARPLRAEAPRLDVDAERLAKVEAFGALIERYSQQYGVDDALVRALIYIESGGDSRALSPRGAAGLMQLMPKTAAALGVDDRFAAEANIAGGVRYLAALIDRYGSAELALWAYNAGPTAVAEGRVPAETRAYVPAVMRLRRYLDRLSDE